MSENTIATSLEEILTLANPRAVYQNQVRLAEMRFQNSCVMGFKGHEFRITPELLGYLQIRVNANTESALITDFNNLPVMIDDIELFMDIASDQYHSALNAYYDEYSRLRSSRKAEKMLEADA